MTLVKEFIDGAKGLARNPLGIIALFVAFVYGFAALLLGAASAHLHAEERAPLVWFVVLFPLVVLGVFYRLVTKYHVNLYSPQDFRDDETFKTLSQTQRAQRLDAEVAAAAASPPQGVAAPVQGQAAAAGAAPSPSLTQEDTNELRMRIMQAERFGLAKFEAEGGLRLRTQVSFGDNDLAAFDGLASTASEVVAVEVKYLREPWVSQRTVDDVLRRALAAEAFMRRRNDSRTLRLMVVFVVGKDAGGLDRLRRVVDAHFKKSPVQAEYRAYFLDDLQKELKDSV